MKKVLPIFLLLTLSLLVASCATSPTGRNQLMLVSPDTAIAASKEAYVETIEPFEEEGKVDSDPELAARVRHVAGRVVAQAIRLFPESKKWDWSIKVLDDDEKVNAWCMAGGKMAVYTGFFVEVKPNDDELAQVLGHEIAHAVANHVAEKMSVAMASQIGMAGLAIAANDSKYRNVALTGAALASLVALKLPNSRVAEGEADLIGIELAARAGYHPDAAASLWEKMENVGDKSPPEFLSTHPSPGNRQQILRELAPKMMQYYNPDIKHPVYKFRN